MSSLPLSPPPPRGRVRRLLDSWWPFVIGAALGLLYTPLRGGFTWVEPSCQWTMAASDWQRVLANPEHIVPFAVLFGLAVGRFERAPVWKTATLVMTFALAMELSQGFFETGHCRLWDWLADGVGVVLAMGVRSAWHASRRATS